MLSDWRDVWPGGLCQSSRRSQMRRVLRVVLLFTLVFACWAMPAAAQAADAQPKIDTGDTSWVLASSALVLLMTIPGLALFYGGLVRSKNVLGTIMQSFIMVGLIT